VYESCANLGPSNRARGLLRILSITQGMAVGAGSVKCAQARLIRVCLGSQVLAFLRAPTPCWCRRRETLHSAALGPVVDRCQRNHRAVKQWKGVDSASHRMWQLHIQPGWIRGTARQSKAVELKRSRCERSEQASPLGSLEVWTGGVHGTQGHGARTDERCVFASPL